MPRKRHAAATDGPQDVLTAREAAKYLRLALPTFYRYMWQGKIPSSKIGGRYWFKKSLLDRWLGKKAEGEDVSGRNKFVAKSQPSSGMPSWRRSIWTWASTRSRL